MCLHVGGLLSVGHHKILDPQFASSKSRYQQNQTDHIINITFLYSVELQLHLFHKRIKFFCSQPTKSHNCFLGFAKAGAHCMDYIKHSIEKVKEKKQRGIKTRKKWT